jgi:hypothetical protein
MNVRVTNNVYITARCEIVTPQASASPLSPSTVLAGRVTVPAAVATERFSNSPGTGSLRLEQFEALERRSANHAFGELRGRHDGRDIDGETGRTRCWSGTKPDDIAPNELPVSTLSAHPLNEIA